CIPALAHISPIVRAHHERWDGTGYPDGLAGEAIPLPARNIAVVDAYTTMRSTRPYCNPRSAGSALAELRRCAGTQFDPIVVAAFEVVLREEVLLDGESVAPTTEDEQVLDRDMDMIA